MSVLQQRNPHALKCVPDGGKEGSHNRKDGEGAMIIYITATFHDGCR